MPIVIQPWMVGIALMAISTFIDKLRELWDRRKYPESAQCEMSETDLEKIDETKELIKEVFGEDVTERVRRASNVERIQLFSDFAKRLAVTYGLDIEVDVDISKAEEWGAYNRLTKKAVFNILGLTIDGNHPQFEAVVREEMDTIIHELRHAVQNRAIEEPGFWNISDERRSAWAQNVANYIQPSVSLRGYANQPIEKDAVTFAEKALGGVF